MLQGHLHHQEHDCSKQSLSTCHASIKIHWEAGLPGYRKRETNKEIDFSKLVIWRFSNTYKRKKNKIKPHLLSFNNFQLMVNLILFIPLSFPSHPLDYCKAKLRCHNISSVNIYAYIIYIIYNYIRYILNMYAHIFKR